MDGENMNYSQPYLSSSDFSAFFLMVALLVSESFPLTKAQISTQPKPQEDPLAAYLFALPPSAPVTPSPLSPHLHSLRDSDLQIVDISTSPNSVSVSTIN